MLTVIRPFKLPSVRKKQIALTRLKLDILQKQVLKLVAVWLNLLFLLKKLLNCKQVAK